MARALIALGGNLGDTQALFRHAIREICALASAQLLARSRDYATPPWGDEDQPRFVNACIEIETALSPHELLTLLLRIEDQHGRQRDPARRCGPRSLDLDLLTYDDLKVEDADLTLPHPRMFERAFVLLPLSDIAPERVIAGRRVNAVLSSLSRKGIEVLPD